MDVKQIVKILELVADPRTPDGEALNGIRGIRMKMAKHGQTFESILRLPPSTRSVAPEEVVPYSEWIDRVNRLTTENSSLDDENKKLRRENDRLRTSQQAGKKTSRSSRKDAPPPEPVKPQREEAAERFPWHERPDVELEAARMFLRGEKLSHIVNFTGANSNQINQRFYNGAPPPGLNASVKTSGPIDWAEIWLIGRTLYRKSWMSRSAAHLGFSGAKFKPPLDVNATASPDRIAEFRAHYFRAANS